MTDKARELAERLYQTPRTGGEVELIAAALAEAERAGRAAVAAEAERHYRASGYRNLTATEVRMLLAGTLAPAALEATK